MAASNQDKTLPDNCITTNLLGLEGKRWLKGAALYGANASGKTTILEAIKALASLVKTSAMMTDPKEPIHQIEPFALGSNTTKTPTAFGVVFITDNIRYEYRVAATQERVWHESLRAYPNKKEQLWFSRDWNSDSKAYTWTPERPTGFHRDLQLEGYTLSNMLFLSKAVASNRSDLEPIFRWFKERLKFLDLSARKGMRINFTLKQIREQSSMSHRIVNLLRHADLGIINAGVVEELPPQEEMEQMLKGMPSDVRERFAKDAWTKPQLSHHGSGTTEFNLPWKSESAGTHRLFSLAGPWLDILDNGYTVCVDELETSMHPLMTRELLRLFFSANENKKAAQILCTTHNPLLLDATLLRRDQTWFTEKDDNGESHLYPLTDYSPRRGESLVRGYLSGRYGAVPFVPTGLQGEFQPHETLSETERESHE